MISKDKQIIGIKGSNGCMHYDIPLPSSARCRECWASLAWSAPAQDSRRRGWAWWAGTRPSCGWTGSGRGCVWELWGAATATCSRHSPATGGSNTAAASGSANTSSHTGLNNWVTILSSFSAQIQVTDLHVTIYSKVRLEGTRSLWTFSHKDWFSFPNHWQGTTSLYVYMVLSLLGKIFMVPMSS